MKLMLATMLVIGMVAALPSGSSKEGSGGSGSSSGVLPSDYCAEYDNMYRYCQEERNYEKCVEAFRLYKPKTPSFKPFGSYDPFRAEKAESKTE